MMPTGIKPNGVTIINDDSFTVTGTLKLGPSWARRSGVETVLRLRHGSRDSDSESRPGRRAAAARLGEYS